MPDEPPDELDDPLEPESRLEEPDDALSDFLPSPEPESPLVFEPALVEPSADPSPLALPDSSFFRAERLDEPRSFLAQPVPLKWTDGAENTFVIVPSDPHSGQNRGPSASMPWTTSVRRWQWEQT